MGRIHVLSDQVANQIAAGEVVDRPASVVKELLENALDAGATRVRIEVEGGGRSLIRIADNGSGMVRDDALLAFERHATSKLRSSSDLLSIATLGFRGEALPAIASVSRLDLTTRAAENLTGTRVEIAGGRVLNCEDTGSPTGTTLTVRDLFYNTPARRKFLKSETTELSHITALVTHYALAHPDKHFELHSATHAILITPPVERRAERIFQLFGRETLDHLLPVAAEIQLERPGIAEPPPWKRDEDYRPADPGFVRLSGFASKPQLEKLNRNSIYCFVNGRLVRDRLLLHAVGEAYRNILAPTSFPVVLLFLEMPPEEVDVNVHPAKTEVRFRQMNVVHNLVRDSIRGKLIAARPAAPFLSALSQNASATPSLAAPVTGAEANPAPAQAERDKESESPALIEEAEAFALAPPSPRPFPGSLPFEAAAPIHEPRANGAGAKIFGTGIPGLEIPGLNLPGPEIPALIIEAQMQAEAGMQAGTLNTLPADFDRSDQPTLHSLASLKPLGQLRESFILAVNEEGLWIIDQHVAHERVLFEKVLRERRARHMERQRLLLPMLVDLLPAQMVIFARIAGELEENGFEVEAFGPRTIAIKAAPSGLEGRELERMLVEVLEQAAQEEPAENQLENLEAARLRIAASIACHSAIKVNTPLDTVRMEWLLAELAKTEHPTSCPHGRPIVLRYAWKEIERAFHRI